MQVTQAKHIIPTYSQDKPLFSSGIEKTLPHILGTDFVFSAKQDGKVINIDNDNEFMVIEYKDKTRDVIDLSSVSSKNSNGGFYISNKKETTLKKGETFKSGDIIAKNPQFFHGGKSDTSYVTGKLAKIAIASGYFTIEDSCLVTDTLSKSMASYITMNKIVTLGANANVEFIAKKGQSIKSGDPLLIFENAFEEAEANKLLDRLGSEFDEAITDLSKNKVKSKYTGEVVEIKIYYNRPIEELSPSLQKIVKKYNSTINSRKKAMDASLNKKGTLNSIINAPTTQIQSNKIQGNDVDGVMIEFFVRYKDELYIGDKLTFSVALKSIVADVIKADEAPYSESDPDEEISAILSPISVISRMTSDVFCQMYLNKVLIGLKKEVKKIYTNK